MKKARRPPASVEKWPGGNLRPVDQYSEDAIAAARPGQVYDLVPREPSRSTLQLRWYWGLLNEIIKATDIMPTAEHLHDATMKDLGWVIKVVNPFTQQVEFARDSLALDKMTHAEANLYITRACERLSEVFDVEDITVIYPPKEKRRW